MVVKVSISLPGKAVITLEATEAEVLHEVVSLALRELPRELVQIRASEGMFSDIERHGKKVPPASETVAEEPEAEEPDPEFDTSMILDLIAGVVSLGFLEKDSPMTVGLVVLLDVLEHFSAGDGVRLLQKIQAVLAPKGRVVIRVPNMSSPWGGIYQFSDLTHKTAFTPNSLEQLAQAAGYRAIAFLPQRRGSPFRRFSEDALHGFLSMILAVTPVVWTANMIGVLEVEAGD